MPKETMFYYFSPTGGTRKVGESFCKAFAQEVRTVDLGDRSESIEEPMCDVVVIAAPVFGGRIPYPVTEKISKLRGEGKKAVTIAVCGTRAYEDALSELNCVAENGGFTVVASAALVAQHSIVPIVGQGRPDATDREEIGQFAEKVEEKILHGNTSRVSVPGNYPYKTQMQTEATPISTADCNKCGRCEAL